MSESTDLETYWVMGTFHFAYRSDPEGYEITDQIGEVELSANATWQDMPKELEINGFTYKLEV